MGRGEMGRVKHEKVRVKRKWWVIAQPPYSPPMVETTGIDHPMRRITQGTGIIKGWEEKRDHGHIPDTLT